MMDLLLGLGGSTPPGLERAWDLLYATDEDQVLGVDDTETKVSVPDAFLLLRTTSGSKTPSLSSLSSPMAPTGLWRSHRSTPQ